MTFCPNSQVYNHVILASWILKKEKKKKKKKKKKKQ